MAFLNILRSRAVAKWKILPDAIVGVPEYISDNSITRSRMRIAVVDRRGVLVPSSVLRAVVGFFIPNILNHHMRVELLYVARVINLFIRGLEDIAVEEDLAFGIWHRHGAGYASVYFGWGGVV